MKKYKLKHKESFCKESECIHFFGDPEKFCIFDNDKWIILKKRKTGEHIGKYMKTESCKYSDYFFPQTGCLKNHIADKLVKEKAGMYYQEIIKAKS